MKEYKVLTQKDRFFSGKFDPERLEQAVNAYAQEGWGVISMATASIPGFGGAKRDELLVLMERGKLMEERFGVPGTVYEEIFFTERAVSPGADAGRISVEISRQNSDLSAVKKKMAAEARRRGADVITSFRYGQRKHPWWRLGLLKWDTESWYGEGDAHRT